MAIALGSNQINKAYLGSTEVQKMYLGGDLVFDNSIQPIVLTPTMTNFRVEDDNPSRILFDAPLGSVAGIEASDFTVSGKTIQGLNTNTNFIDVTTPFNFWDNNTIRLENGNGVVYDFTMEHIKNNIAEPPAATLRYVDVGGSGDGSEGSPWSMVQALTNMTAGMTIYVKAGDYGDIKQQFTITADIDNPVKFIGYKTDWAANDGNGDITSNYYDNGVTYDTSEMPSFSNINDTLYTIRFNNARHLIFKNFQFSGGNCNLDWLNTSFLDHAHLENINVLTSLRPTGIVFFYDNPGTELHQVRLKGCVVMSQSLNNILLRGAGHNMIENCKSYSTETSGAPDYLLGVGGPNNIIKGCHVDVTVQPDSSTHSLYIRDAYRGDSHHNLIMSSTSINASHTLDFRNTGTSDSVAKDCQVTGTTASQRGGIDFNGCGDNNIVERCYIKDVRQGIEIREDAGEGSDGTGIGVNNQVRNCIFDNVSEGAVYTSGNSGGTVSFDDFKIYNNTFNDCAYFTSEGNTVALSNFLVKNNIFKDVISNGNSGGSASNFIFDYNSFSGCWTTGIGVNDIEADPLFADEIDFLPTNEALYLDAVTGIYYDYNKKERTSLESTIGGVTLVSENAGTQPPVTGLTPIMTNFRVENANPNWVYFDTPLGSVTGLTIQGFIVSGNTVSSIDTVNNYFTVGTPFTFWDNNTIRLESGDGTIHDFTMEYIENNVNEPASFTERFVTETGGGLHDGSSEADAWDFSEMELAAGRIIWMKVGDYGNQQIPVSSVGGYDDGPTQIVGYKTTHGDITSNYWTYGMAFDSSEMPLFDGAGTDNARGIFINNSDNVIIKNLQFQNYGVLGNDNNYGVVTENSNHIVLENINVNNTNRCIFGTGSNIRTKNCNAFNGWGFNFFASGDFNLSLNNKSYCDDVSSLEAGLDYYYACIGNNNIHKGNYAKRVGNVQHFGHGLAYYDSPPVTCNYNLSEDHTVVNILQSLEYRHTPVQYNVTRNLQIYGEGTGTDTVGGVILRDGTSYNTIENSKINLLGATSECCVYFQDQTETGIGFANNNIFKNNIFINSEFFMKIQDYTAGSPTGVNNNFYNNTIYNINYMLREYNVTIGIEANLTNNIFDSVNNETFGAIVSSLVYDGNNFYNGFTAKGTNYKTLNPDFVDDFVPQAETMKAPTISGVHYDYNDDQRDETETTIGAVMLVSEKQ